MFSLGITAKDDKYTKAYDSSKEQAAKDKFEHESGMRIEDVGAVAIDEVAEVDVHAAAARMRLRPIEAAALFFSGCVVLSGLGLYVISEQSSPRRGIAQAAGNALFLSIILAYCCIIRIVWVARRKRPSKLSDDDPPA